MTLPELLQSLSVSGFSLRLFGCTAVEITGPMDRMTDAMRDALREYKPSLLELLKPRAAGWEEPEQDTKNAPDTDVPGMFVLF